MGTTYHIIAIASDSVDTTTIQKKKLKQQIDDQLKAINQQMSTYQIDSEISQFNRYTKTDWFTVSHDFAFVVSNAQKVSQLTHGAFDITVSPLVNLWGFGTKNQNKIPSNHEISAALDNTGFSHLTVRLQPPSLKKEHLSLTIDLSAIAKGFAVDAVSHFLEEQGFYNHLIEIGGEVKTRGKNTDNKDWQIAIEQPKKTHIANNNANHNTNKIISVSNLGIATSGDYRNYFIKDGIRFSHTIDPKTGKPITHQLASVTILNKSCMIADAYATAVMVLGENTGKTFILNNNIKANMIIREGDKFITWSNLLDGKNVKKGGGG